MTHPTFQSRAELEAWATKIAREAQAHYILGERTALLDALKTIRRVTAAHAHLED